MGAIPAPAPKRSFPPGPLLTDPGTPGVSERARPFDEWAPFPPPPPPPFIAMPLTAAEETITPEGRPGLLIDWEMERGRWEAELPVADQGSSCWLAEEGGDEWEGAGDAEEGALREARIAEAVMLWWGMLVRAEEGVDELPPPLSAPRSLLCC